MPKILMVFLSVIKSAIFKNKNQYNVKSKEFDILKVVIFLYICVSFIFTLYSVQYMGQQSNEIDTLTQYNIDVTSINRCIVNSLNDYMDMLVLDNKAAQIHTHTVSDISDFQISLDSKADIIPRHEISEINGLEINKDYELAYCPERIDPVNKKYWVGNINRVCGATSNDTLNKVCNFF